MGPLDFAKRRLKAFIEQVKRLKVNDFPYPHAREALNRVQDRFGAHLQDLEQLTASNDPDAARQACSETLRQISLYLPLLGFLIRSTDVRNSFEVYAPLLRLSRQFLGPQAKLVLSSEWSFSPYTFSYGVFQGLEDFVMIGLPAQESSNALLIPLAGHELGHSVWRHRQLSNQFVPSTLQYIHADLKQRWAEWMSIHAEPNATPENPDLFTVQAVGRAHAWAMRQAEETFCDLLGLRLFGTSYLQAFGYLLAPGGLGRPYFYPDLKRRIENLVDAATTYGLMVPAGYVDWFLEDSPSPKPDRENGFLLSLADASAARVIPDLLLSIDTILQSAGVISGTDSEVERVLQSYRLVVPASGTQSLSDIINAAWAADTDDSFWDANPAVQREKTSVLTELTLKSIEVQEVEARTAAKP